MLSPSWALGEILESRLFELGTLQFPHHHGPLNGADAVGVGASEDDVEFLERAALRFGEEEVYGGHNGRVENGEHDVGSVFEVGEGGGRDHDDQEVGEL